MWSNSCSRSVRRRTIHRERVDPPLPVYAVDGVREFVVGLVVYLVRDVAGRPLLIADRCVPLRNSLKAALARCGERLHLDAVPRLGEV